MVIRRFSTSAVKFSNKLYDNHIPLTGLQKLLLAIGSGVGAIVDPYRHDLVADFGEATGYKSLQWISTRMKSSEEGRMILEDKPRLHSRSVDYKKLELLPNNTFGYHYAHFYLKNGVSPDTRKTVQFVDDVQLSYIMQRYRELHDIVHTILNQPTTIKGEVIVKAFEGVQTRLPLCLLGGLIGPIRLNQSDLAEYLTRDLAWAIKCGLESKFIMNVYFEKRFDQDIDDLRRELNVKLPN